MAKVRLDNNILNAKDFAISMAELTSASEFVLKDMRENFKYVDGKKTDVQDGYKLSIADPDTFAMYTIKAEKVDFTLEEVEKSVTPVFIEIPTEKTMVIPYDISYGRAHVSIIAPFVTIVKD